MIFLDQRQSQVDTRADAGGRPQRRRAAHKDRVRVDVDRRKLPRQFVGEGPVRGRPAAVEQAGLRGQKSSGAHGDDPAGMGRRRDDPVDEARVAPAVMRTPTARQDQGVDGLTRVGQFDGAEGQPGLGGHRLPVE